MKLRHAAALLLLVPLALPAETLVISGARVHTVGAQGTLDAATIVVEDGVIAAVGTNVNVPAGATLVDAAGKIVTPGLFSPLGRIGLTEVNAVTGTVDYVQRGDTHTAGFDVTDAFNPRSTLVAANRIEGITRAAITPEAAAPDALGNVSRVLTGRGSIVHLGGADAPVVRRGAVLVVYLGEAGGTFAGGSRALALQQLRTALDDALDYAGHREAFEQRARRDYAVSRADLESLQDVIEGRIPVLARVDRASDIRVLLALAEEYKLKLIIAGGAEAWMLADEIAAARAGVILDSVNNLPGNFDQLNARLDSAALLADAGVDVSFGMHGNMQSHNARNLTQAAGIAVANGLTWETALRAITLTPAEFYGVADRIGSIEVGKEADLVIWDGDPLELTNYPRQVYIRGIAVPMQSRQTLLRDRYLDRNASLPPAFRR